jgi:lambda repressor-like predicted transcriptional regulator
MPSKNVAGLRLQAYLLDHGLTAEQLGEQIGLSGMTLRRVIDGYPCTIRTKFLVARVLQEDPSTLWPPITRRRKVAA